MTITTAEAKAHLRIDHDDEDSYISTLIDAAYDFAENYTGRKIRDQEVSESLDDFKEEIELKYNPVQSITSITYYDSNDTQQSQTDYFLDTKELRAILKPDYDDSWPSTNCDYENVVITYQVGYSTIPDAVNQAVLLIIGSLYDQRENHIGTTINKIPVSAEYLLSPYRIVSV
jgi:uncharacterized phiE125 gp8 family phage protein